MNRNIKRQDGVTLIGLVLILGVIAAFVLMGLRLFPLYNEKFRVLQIMKTVTSQSDAATMTQAQMQKVFYSNATIQSSTVFNRQTVVSENVKLEKGEGGGVPLIHVTFELRNPLFDDFELVLNFDESMPMSGGNE